MTKPHKLAIKLGMMAKFWQPGFAKTRLAADYGERNAAEVHRVLTLWLASSLRQTADSRIVFATPEDRCPQIAAELGPTWQVHPQGAGDLGQRMEQAFKSLLATQADVDPSAKSLGILIGTDMPLLDAQIIADASERLRDADLVLGPAIDGGYYLIGLRGPWRADYEPLFRGIEWSSELVLGQTLDRANAVGLRVSLLVEAEDIDTLEDLHRWLIDPRLPGELGSQLRAICAG